MNITAFIIITTHRVHWVGAQLKLWSSSVQSWRLFCNFPFVLLGNIKQSISCMLRSEYREIMSCFDYSTHIDHLYSIIIIIVPIF